MRGCTGRSVSGRLANLSLNWRTSRVGGRRSFAISCFFLGLSVVFCALDPLEFHAFAALCLGPPGQFVDPKHKVMRLLPHYKIPKRFSRSIHASIFGKLRNIVKICCYQAQVCHR
jgi:hypothetical protein